MKRYVKATKAETLKQTAAKRAAIKRAAYDVGLVDTIAQIVASVYPEDRVTDTKVTVYINREYFIKIYVGLQQGSYDVYLNEDGWVITESSGAYYGTEWRHNGQPVRQAVVAEHARIEPMIEAVAAAGYRS